MRFRAAHLIKTEQKLDSLIDSKRLGGDIESNRGRNSGIKGEMQGRKDEEGNQSREDHFCVYVVLIPVRPVVTHRL